MTNRQWRQFVINHIPRARHYVGIPTGGVVIAMAAVVNYDAEYSLVKDGELKGSKPGRGYDWILIDDVATTGNSLLKALFLIETPPREIFVVVDRRKDKSKLNISSLFQV